MSWVQLCCVVCRRHRWVTEWVAGIAGGCRHVGTVHQRAFWLAAGEPKAVDLQDELERQQWAAAAAGRAQLAG